MLWNPAGAGELAPRRSGLQICSAEKERKGEDCRHFGYTRGVHVGFQGGRCLFFFVSAFLLFPLSSLHLHPLVYVDRASGRRARASWEQATSEEIFGTKIFTHNDLWIATCLYTKVRPSVKRKLVFLRGRAIQLTSCPAWAQLG